MPDYTSHEAHGEYSKRLGLAQQAVTHYENRHIRVGNWRFAIFAMGLALAYLAFLRHSASPLWLVLLLVIFISLAFVDDVVLRRKHFQERRVDYYRRGLSRVEEKWQGTGNSGARFASATHPYAADLDLFSPGGLFELLSVARTRLGESLLAEWLMAPADLPQIQNRHTAVRELRTLLDFREALATVGAHVLTEREAAPLWKWGEAAAVPVSSRTRLLAAALSIAMACSLAWFAFAELQWLVGAVAQPPLLSLVVLLILAALTITFGLWWQKPVSQSVLDFETIRPGLALLSDLLVLVEHAHFAVPELQALQSELLGAVKPSRQIACLNRFADLLDSRDNLFVRIFGPPLLWTTHVAFAIEQWRAKYGPITRAWVDAVSEIEALSSIATYAYEHPDDPFPELHNGSAWFDAVDLGHPLLPASVRNSLTLDAQHSLLIVSGSNMSGKSTLLRTVGINAVLALAGAPVRARALRMSALRIATSLHVADSLKEGESHFSAEISRIRQIVEIARASKPALFLIDELLQGTNSRDRLVGAQAILNRLMELGAIGLITTHDLALTNIAVSRPERAANVHFEDQIRDGQMTFDYTLKPGVIQGSNALELMRLYGLL
jgi:MutS domain V